jgi:NAD(P)-dependent dehydrogenase (short-subunit alcohol dehydrogenase family)
LRKAGIACETAAFDVADFAAVRAFFGGLSRLDIIVNNAIAMTPRPRDGLSPEDFDQTYRSGVTAAFEIVRAALPALRQAVAETGDASIVNIASMYGMVAPDSRLYTLPGQASPFHYGPAKAALLQLSRHLAAELGADKIRVNALVPGPFPADAVRARDPGFAARLGARTMLGRTGQAHEIRGPVLFLAAPASGFVTGATLAADGGWMAW